jgi:hypothetical protein
MSTKPVGTQRLLANALSLLQLLLTLAGLLAVVTLPYWCYRELADLESPPRYRWLFQVGFVLGLLAVVFLAFLLVYFIFTTISWRRRRRPVR